MDPPRETEKADRSRHDPGAAVTGGSKKPDNKSKKDKSKDSKGKDGGAGGKDPAGGTKRGKKSKKDIVKPMTRVVVRHLPPTMTEEQFRDEISVEGAFPKHEEFYFVGPDWSLGMSATSRAYIKFTNPDDVLLFTHRFDGYTFLDSKGAEFLALVEYAPFQKLPKNRSRSKADPKCNTIESDPLFIAFKEALEAEEREAQQGRGTQEFSFNLEPEEKIVMTPLLEYVAQRKLEKRDERRRKQEEKRKAREEERSIRKSQIAQAIPESIKEEKEITEIMVRTVPSRLDPAQNASKGGGSDNKKGGCGEAGGKHKDDKKARNRNNNNNKDYKDNKDSKDKDRKDRDRKQEEDHNKQPTGPRKGDNEKNASKKLDRDKIPKKILTAADRDKGKDDPRASQKKNGRPEKEKPRKGDKMQDVVQVDRGGGDPPASDNAPSVVDPSAEVSVAPGKKESKRYSERRKETRARAETRFAEQGDSRNDAKIDVKKSVLMADVPAFIPKQKTTIILHGPSSTATSNPPATLPSLPSSIPNTSTNNSSSQVVSEGNETTDNGKSPSPDALLEAADAMGTSGGKRADEEQIRRKLKEAREARKIRNKDRPSMEIYQPRKRIGAAKSEEERWDSDRPSDSISTAPASAAADGANERRHRLTKKASDRQTHSDRKAARRKNSSDADITPNEAAEVTGTPPASLPEV
ncbi:regulator of nonsense transcripts 3A [Anopheles aquasalis]|uniref:regulator of nonsense transcripts 3A n=1 Tax=Anopheles aquasalis TaxID=42839 RepID=UPI00215B39A6|nr:regulator of nonsense transcripts 3A [Anopheles aquasalis]